jgi:hypothetical protein
MGLCHHCNGTGWGMWGEYRSRLRDAWLFGHQAMALLLTNATLRLWAVNEGGSKWDEGTQFRRWSDLLPDQIYSDVDLRQICPSQEMIPSPVIILHFSKGSSQSNIQGTFSANSKSSLSRLVASPIRWRPYSIIWPPRSCIMELSRKSFILKRDFYLIYSYPTSQRPLSDSRDLVADSMFGQMVLLPDLQDTRCWLSLLFRRRKDEILNAFQISFNLCSFMQNVYLVRLFGVSKFGLRQNIPVEKLANIPKLILEAWVFSVSSYSHRLPRLSYPYMKPSSNTSSDHFTITTDSRLLRTEAIDSVGVYDESFDSEYDPSRQ